MYDSEETKEIYAKAGLADIIHKLWAHSSQDKKLLIGTLKLLSTFTSNCKEGKDFIQFKKSSAIMFQLTKIIIIIIGKNLM